MLTTISKPIAWTAEHFDFILAPLQTMTDGLLGSLIALAVCCGLWAVFHLDFKPNAIESAIKIQMPWVYGAFLVGLYTGISGEYAGISMIGDTMKLTHLNILEWQEFAQLSLASMCYGFIFCVLLYLALKGPVSALGVASTFPLMYFLGKSYALLRIAILCTLGKIWLLRLPIQLGLGLLDSLLMILQPLMFVVFILPTGAIEALNERSRKREREALLHRSSESDSVNSDAAFSVEMKPISARDENGNSYRAYTDGDLLYIDFSSGRLCTEWDEIAGDTHVNVGGHWFYLQYGY